MLQGFEALLRWDHPTMGPISPERFIPLAEESGMIAGLGRWVLARALGDLGKLSKAAGHELSMNVNLSVKQLFMDELEGFIAGLLQKHDIRPDRLHLEITESVIMHSELLPKLEALRNLGAKIGIDDFGTGYSSLGYLKDMPIDFLKIDKSFVSGQGKADKEIVTTLINLADRLNLEVVAEGVESLEQMDQLRDMGCKLGQGFYFSKPVPQDLACRLPPQFR
jgi:Amt family ammonium transporter